MKKILIISPHFYPENFKCNDVAFELVKRNYSVTVLSDIPNYPGGKFYNGYGLFKKRKEIVNGVKILRTAMIPRGNGSGKMLALNYLSFALTASIRAFFMALFSTYDVVIVHETSPITVGIPAVIIKKISKQTKLLFWVLDLWPESLQVAGGISNKRILGFFAWIAKMCYKNSDKILMSSMGFKQSICEKGDFEAKLEYFPNWAEDKLNADIDYKLPPMPNGFKLMFAGNIGEAQDFNHTLEAAKILHLRGRNDIHFIFVGDGRKKVWVEEYVRANHLSSTVHCMGRHPLESMGKFFQSANILYLALKDSLIFNLTCPAKLQAYMSAGKPVLAMLNGEGSEIIKQAKCGFSVNAGDSNGLANMIEYIATLPKTTLDNMGMNGKQYCNQMFSFKKNIDNLENWLQKS